MPRKPVVFFLISLLAMRAYAQAGTGTAGAGASTTTTTIPAAGTAALAPTAPATGTTAPVATAPVPAATAPVPAATAPAPAAKGAAELAAMSELQRKTLSMDIAVSTWYELADKCRSLGLAAEGSAADLRKRLYEYYGLSAPAVPAGESSVTVERASSLSWSDAVKGSPNVLSVSGGVKVSIRGADGFLHRIEAWTVSYDRAANTATAEGDVRYLREGQGRSDLFTGQSLRVDLNDYSGVFIDGGFGLAPSAGDTRTLSLRSDRITLRNEDVVLFEDASVTACDLPEPHYTVTAKKVWLLGSGDWAMSDVVLYVGKVPVLWLPFFYNPSDEIVFHPVFGFLAREGAYVQTTTYLIGKKAAAGRNSGLLSIVQKTGADAGDQVRKGIFLRRTSSTEPAAETGKAVSKPAGIVRLLADLYSALGAHVGVDGTFPLGGKEGGLDFSVGLALSRSVFRESTGYYSPFDAAAEYASVWNRSSFLGSDLPFRYRLAVKASTGIKKEGSDLQLYAELPLASDPYMEYDFRYRSEDMNWLSLGGDTTAARPSKLSVLAQKAGLTWSWRPAGALNFWLNSLRVTQLAIQATWNSRSRSTSGFTSDEFRLNAVDPAREFYYPDGIRPLNAAVSLGGNLLKYSSGQGFDFRPSAQAPKTAVGKKAETAPAITLREPAGEDGFGAEPETGAGVATRSDISAGAAPGQATPDGSDLRFPAAAESPRASAAATGLSFNAAWTGNMSGYLEEKFYSTAWTKSGDIDFKPAWFLASWKANGGITTSTSILNSLVTVNLGLDVRAQDQQRPYLLDDRTSPTTVHPYLVSDYRYRTSSVGSNLTASLKPFRDAWLWSPTSLTWSLSTLWFKSLYYGLDGTGADAKPVYTDKWFGWDAESVTANALALALGVQPLGYIQRLTFSADLPPRLESYGLKLDLDSKYADLSVTQKFARVAVDAGLLPDPISARLILGARPGPVLNTDFSWDFQGDTPVSLSAAVNWGTFTSSYIMKQALGYTLDSTGVWTSDGSQNFRPYEFALAYSPKLDFVIAAKGAAPPPAPAPAEKPGTSTPTEGGAQSPSTGTETAGGTGTTPAGTDAAPAGTTPAPAALTQPSGTAAKAPKVSLKGTARVALNQNLVRYTLSTLSFSADLSLAIGDVFSLTFSGLTTNSQAWRYWPGLFPVYDDIDPNDYFVNPVADLADSLSVWNRASLERTLLKLQKLTIGMKQDLHDWVAAADLALKPILDTSTAGRPRYRMEFDFTISLTWKDVPEVAAKIVRDSAGLRY